MKVLRLKLFQERAHFRNPKIISPNLVPSLPLPPATTIAGMLTTLYGKRFGEELDFAIIGSYERTYYDFQRTDSTKFYNKWQKSLKLKNLINVNHEVYESIKNNIFNFKSLKNIEFDEIKELKEFKNLIKKITDEELELITKTELDKKYTLENFKDYKKISQYFDELDSQNLESVKKLNSIGENKYNNLVKFLKERDIIIKEIKLIENQEDYSGFKKRNKMQGISTFEILYQPFNLDDGGKKIPNLIIYVKIKNKNTLEELNAKLKDIDVYPSLGRKEDYAEILKSEIIEINQIETNVKEAIKNKLKFQNCYLKLDFDSLNNYSSYLETQFQNEISDIGTLFTMPRTYKDLNAKKSDRKYIHGNYIYVGSDSRYLGGKFFKDEEEKTIFKWLVN